MRAPELPRHCGSWVIVRRSTLDAVCETFSRAVADFAAQSPRYDVLTAADYLGQLNASIRACA